MIVQHLNRLREDAICPLSKVDYFIDEEGSFVSQDQLATRFQGPAENAVKGKRLILVSGPDGFINYLAGPKKWEAGREVQGSLGGILARLDLRGWEVWKL